MHASHMNGLTKLMYVVKLHEVCLSNMFVQSRVRNGFTEHAQILPKIPSAAPSDGCHCWYLIL